MACAVAEACPVRLAATFAIAQILLGELTQLQLQIGWQDVEIEVYRIVFIRIGGAHAHPVGLAFFAFNRT